MTILRRPHLDEEESHSVSSQRSAQLNVSKSGIDFAQIVKPAMICENVLFNSLQLGVFSGQELCQLQEAWLVLGLVVVAILDLALERRKLDALLTCAWVSAIHNGVS